MQNIVVYSGAKCAQCSLTYKELERQGFDYDVVDITGDETKLDYLRDLGFRQLPVVMVEGQSWQGFRPDLIRQIGKIA